MPYAKAATIARGFGGFCIVGTVYMLLLGLVTQVFKILNVGPQSNPVVQIVYAVIGALFVTVLTRYTFLFVEKWSRHWFY